MKKEYVLYEYSRIFKGLVDEKIFNDSHNRLFNIVIKKHIDIRDKDLYSFASNYLDMCKTIYTKAEEMEQIVGESGNNSNLIKRVTNNLKLRRLKRAYSNALKFNKTFENVFDIDLHCVLIVAEIKQIIEDSKNGVW